MGFLTRTQSMGIAALALGMCAFLSRIFGLVRDKVVSYYFGAGPDVDIYNMAFVAPDFLNYLLAGGYFSITLVPLLSSLFAKDEEDAKRFFSAAVLWAFLLIFSLSAVVFIFAPQVAAVLAPRFTPEMQERLAHFLRIILPAQVFFLPGACFSAMLYYRRQFAAPALMPLVYNSGIILGGIIGIHLAPERGMEGFCWGVPVGALIGNLLLPMLAVRAGGSVFRFTLLHPDLKKLLLLALPLMLGQSVAALDEQFVRFFGGLAGDGAISLLSYARRIMQVPVGVVAQAAGLASFPFLAALAASKDVEGFDAALRRSLHSTVLVALPLSLCLMAVGEPVMRLIFRQGRFTAVDAAQSGLLLSVMLAGVVFWALQQIMGRAFYARRDTVTPALAGTAATVLALPLYYFGAVHLQAFGVAVAGGAGIMLYALILWGIWSRRFGKGGTAGVWGRILGSLLFCLPASAAAYFAQRYTGKLFGLESLWGAAAQITAGGLVFTILYLGATLLFAPDVCAPIRDFGARVFSRLRRRGHETGSRPGN